MSDSSFVYSAKLTNWVHSLIRNKSQENQQQQQQKINQTKQSKFTSLYFYFGCFGVIHCEQFVCIVVIFFGKIESVTDKAPLQLIYEILPLFLLCAHNTQIKSFSSAENLVKTKSGTQVQKTRVKDEQENIVDVFFSLLNMFIILVYVFCLNFWKEKTETFLCLFGCTQSVYRTFSFHPLKFSVVSLVWNLFYFSVSFFLLLFILLFVIRLVSVYHRYRLNAE